MSHSPVLESNIDNSQLVSVIIPTYNRAHYIKECIISVLEQTYVNLEVLVIDDGSTDNTENIVNSIQDSRLRYIRQENKGRSHARNLALSMAHGKYITFLDSDDLYLPEKIELQVNYLKMHPNVAMVYTSAYCINHTGKKCIGKYEAKISGYIYQQIAFFTPVTITLPTVMTYKHVMDHVGGFDENMYRFEDTDMWRRISKYYRIDAMSEYTCKLRTHNDNSLLNQNPAQLIAAIDYYTKKIMRDDKDIDLSIRKNGIADLYKHYGRTFMTVPKFRSDGKKLLNTAFTYDYGNNFVSYLPKNLFKKVFHKTLDTYWKVLKQKTF
jgi:glycosyltransferase involved in cell wall biosynthesis